MTHGRYEMRNGVMVALPRQRFRAVTRYPNGDGKETVAMSYDYHALLDFTDRHLAATGCELVRIEPVS